MNKAKAGYCMLMILSAVDNEFQKEENSVVKDYVKKMWPKHFDSKACDDMIFELWPQEWMPKFEECSDFFYAESDAKERNEFLQFAMNLVKADDVITKEENHFLKSIFDAWDPDNE